MTYSPITIQRTSSSDVDSAVSNPNNSRNFLNSADGAGETLVDFTAKTSPSGDFLKAIGFNTIVNSIRNLLLTPKGSYPFDPTYGSLLHEKIFMPADKTTEDEIKFEVIERIIQFDDRVRVLSVDTQYYNNKRGYRVNIVLQRYNTDQGITIDFPEELYSTSNPAEVDR